MQGGIYTPYMGGGPGYAQTASSMHVEPAAATAIGGHPFGLPQGIASAVLEDLVPPSDAEARGQLALLQLPVGSAAPTQSAWCSVSNLVAVAFTPEEGSSTARILILEPSNPEDCTELELPMAGPGDYISSLEWSWPGQRRALLSATASGRLVVWTQPSQQGQDDAVLPRCIDDWHGQLLHEAHPSPAQQANGNPAPVPADVKPDPASQGMRQSAIGVPYIKPEPDAGGGLEPQQQEQQEQRRWMQPVLAAVCWLRQPPGGRVWSTSLLAMKRLDPGYDCRTAGGGGGGAGVGGPSENFDTLFSEEPVAPGCVPHWARPHQLTAAFLSSDGSLTFIWSTASKLPNTLSWHRSRTVRIPTPPEPAVGVEAAAATGDPAEWCIAAGSMCAVHDGRLLVAAMYGRWRDAVYLYGMRGNPTLSGQPVSQPGASAAAGATATAATTGGGGTTTATGGREAPQPTVTQLARLALPQGLIVRQCALHMSGTASKHAFVLAQAAPRQPLPALAPSHHPHHHHHHQHLGKHGSVGRDQKGDTQQQPVVVVCYSESPDDGGGGGGGGLKGAAAGAAWRLERVSAQLEPRGSGGGGSGTAGVEPEGSGAAAATDAAAAAVAPVGPSMGLSSEGSKLAVSCGAVVYSLDSETLTVLAAQDLEQLGAAEAAGGQPGGSGSVYGNGAVTDAATPPPQPVLAATACLSANSCCLCSLARLGPRPAAAAAGRAGGTAARDVEPGDTADGNEDDSDADDDDDAGLSSGGVMLSICTVPDVVPLPSASAGMACGGGGPGSLEGVEDTIACNMDTLRLAWGLLNRLSLWDVSERMRCAWLSGRREHVARSLDQLDGLLYGHEDIPLRVALAAGISRVKLAVLRRIPHPQAAILAADLLAAARIVQYSQTISQLLYQPAEALSHEETRSVVGHMIWFVLEFQILMLAGLRLWAESAEKRQQQQQQQQQGTPAGQGQGAEADTATSGQQGAGGGAAATLDSAENLPLIRLFPDYTLSKHVQMVLLGPGPATAGAKQGSEGRATLVMLPAVQEFLGGPDVFHRARALNAISNHLNRAANKVLNSHVQALHQQQQQGGAGGGAAQGLVPGAAVAPVTAADLEFTVKSGDMPRTLMQRMLQSTFGGPFHLHYSRCKGLFTAASIAQCFRQEEMSRFLPLISLSREALLERYRALGLQQQLMDLRRAPHVAARRMWMSFRTRAPAPELHSHILTHQVSSRQRQRWRRQRAAALALGGSAALWANVQGARVDCLTGVPLPPATSWSLEGAEAIGAVTAQMGPGVGAAASRRNLPPLLSAIQRAWVCSAAPAELGSTWKRARLGLEQDMEY